MNDTVEFPAVVDASMMTEWRACKHKLYRSYLQHWKPQGESVHLHFGACFAGALETARISFYEQEKTQDDSIADALRTFIQMWGDFQPPEGSAKTLERGLGAVEFYFNEWPMGTGAKPHLMPSGRHGIEFSFAQPLPYMHPVTGEPIIYAGRCDMIADFAEGLYLEDDKTASQLGDSWAKQWELRGQFTGYCWAAREIGLSPNGVLVRGVSILKTKYGAAQALTYRSAAEIDEWLATTLDDLADMEAAWTRGVFRKNLGESCSSYGGCQFVPVCKSQDPETWLKVYFERSQWDPLERISHKLD